MIKINPNTGIEYVDYSKEKKPKLKLVGNDGNAFAILGNAYRVACANNMDWDKIKTEAMSGDYDHLLQTMMKYFDVE